MPQPIILYSTNTWLSFVIAERYYAGVHYIWCSPYFATRANAAFANPPTSTPADIYYNLFDEVTRGDQHSAKIASNRTGILRGTAHKKAAGIINDVQEDEIKAVVAAGVIQDFRPLLYIVPFEMVRTVIKTVPVALRAHPLSEEFILEAISSDSFDIITLGR